jgi:hypothetical protein
LRRAGDRRRTGRADGGARGRPRRARVILCDEDFRSAAGCSPSGTRSTASRRSNGRARRRSRARRAAGRAHHAPHHGHRRVSTAAQYGASSASTITCRAARARAAPARWRSSPSARCSPPARSNGRSSFGGNDRPGVMLAGAMRAYINRYAAAPGRRIACSPTMTTAGARRRRPCGRDRVARRRLARRAARAIRRRSASKR